MQKQILAHHDAEGIWVYQAFKPSIVQAALARGTFGKGFGMDRMTWIKPSFGWMLHRSGYATKHRQEAILKIKLSHRAFTTILAHSVQTSYSPDLHATEREWRSALERSKVRHQWDPDRDPYGCKLPRRAIQIGIRGEILHSYVHDGWIISLADVSALAREIHTAVREKRNLPEVPAETVYRVDAALGRRLGISDETADLLSPSDK